MENNDKIVEENVQLVEESVDAADTNSEATSEVVSDTINQEEVVTPIVTDKPVKRRKKDIIVYNPETG